MWNHRLGLGLNATLGVPFEQQPKLVREAGFDACFCKWEPDFLPPMAKIIREEGLILQSVHASFRHAADFWSDDGEKGRAAVEELIACLADCAAVGAPIAVVHAFIGFQDHDPTPVGVERFGEAVRAAERYGVKIAFENTEGEEYFSALMDAFRGNPTVGFCWDSGHEMCYNHSQDLLARYGDRLIATHLNDNLGIRDYDGVITFLDDLHLLPFDGIADWNYNAARLKNCGYEDILTFELLRASKKGRHDNDRYQDMTPEEYLAAAFQRACRVAALLDR